MSQVVTSLDLQVRFGDTDALGHVNNAVYASYAELGRIDYIARVGLPATGFILARLAMDFRRQVKLGEACRITTEIVRVGTTSMTMRQVMYAAEEVACEYEAVVVWFDYRTNKPVPIPAEQRALIAL
ncbi:MAG: thioesterase family protein [Trueperaceae bacterium]